MTKQPEQLPAHAIAEQGEVLVDGPNGFVASLTPEAARDTARALRTAAREAQQQRRDVKKPSAAREHEAGGSDQA